MSEIIANMASPGLDRIRGDLESFQNELMEEYYRHYAGLKDDLSTAPIFDRFQHLFSLDSINEVAACMDEIGPDGDSRWAKYLRSFSTLGYIENSVKQVTDKAHTWEAGAKVEFDGETIPYRMVPIKLLNEPDAERRHALFEAKLGRTEELNEILLERMGTMHDMSAELAYKSYRDMCSSLKGIDYRQLEDKMEDLLRRTEKIYLTEMDQMLTARAGISLSNAWSCDVPYTFKGADFDKYFDKEKLVPAFNETLKDMGIDPGSYSNIHVDTEEREKKMPRAFCAPVKVPDDIKLVIRPVGGWTDYGAFFHEGGHAWHFGSARADLPAEYRYLGDNSVTEAFAFLFDYLTTNSLWLKSRLGMETAEEFGRFALTSKLMFLRRYASKLIYEMKLHQGKVEKEHQEVYKATLQRGLKLRHTEKHYLEDVDDAFYCAEYLRAWVFEGQLREAMVEKFGEEWFQNENAGPYLKELWSYGQKFPAEELIQTIGYVELDIEPLLEEIEVGLQS